MRKNLLALSIAAMVGGLSGAANAQVALFDNSAATNTSGTGNTPAKAYVGLTQAGFAAATQLQPTTTGIGHVLVVPYFTSQTANHSLLSITNTDLVNGKAVKLRYRGASNSDDVFDITVYLSPGDVWAADVAAENDFSRLQTDDNSCTLPSKAEIKATNNGRFKVNRVRGGDAAQTREGYIEILNSADIRPFLNNDAGVQDPTKPNPLYAAIKHNADGVAPCTAAVMDQQATALDFTNPDSPDTPRNRGYSWPTGGLFANWLIVNVATNASFSGEAVALRASSSAVIDGTGSGNLVWFPQTTESVAQANAAQLTADPLLSLGAPAPLRAAMYDFPDLSTPYTRAAAGVPSTQASDLAFALETLSVTNEYLTAASSGGFATDWVFSMPTRRYAVAMNYAASSAPAGVSRNLAVARHFGAGNLTTNANWQICVDAGNLRGFDREERSKTTFVISPDMSMRFCGEASVLSFNSATSAVLGAQIATQQIPTGFAEGWFTVRTPGVTSTAALPVGLPVVGYAAAKANSGNLGGTWMHRTARP
ncbi:cell surface protein [Acidovorax sp. YS12]|nr:cell surface protein [Acidovorax sp. YS12]